MESIRRKQKFSLKVGITLTLIAFTADFAGAEATPLNPRPESSVEMEALRLEDLLQRAREKSPEILAAQAEWLAAKKRVWIDTSLPDPMGEYDIMGSMRETRTGPEKNRFMISQEIPFPGKLWQKGKMAKAEARAARARLRAIERDVVNKLEKLYYELYFADASIQALEEIQDLLKKLEKVAQARYASLSASQRDVAKAQAEVSMSLEKLFILQQERESVAAMINAILDQDPMAPVGKAVPPEKPVSTHSLIELVNLAVENRQEIKEREALVEKSGHAKRLAQLAYIPDINVGFEYTRVGSGTTLESSDMDGRDQWMFPLRINLPLWQNRIVPEIQEAQKMIEMNRARLLEAKNTAYYEVKDAYYRYDSASKITELYETAVIPQAKLALSSDQAAYEAGKTDFLNLLDSERVYLNAKLNQIQFFTESLKSYADLMRATGADQ